MTYLAGFSCQPLRGDRPRSIDRLQLTRPDFYFFGHAPACRKRRSLTLWIRIFKPCSKHCAGGPRKEVRSNAAQVPGKTECKCKNPCLPAIRSGSETRIMFAIDGRVWEHECKSPALSQVQFTSSFHKK